MKRTFHTIAEVCDDYKLIGYNHQQLELKQYSINDIEGLVSGYKPHVLIDGQEKILWCCGNSINTNEIILLPPSDWPHPHQWWMKGKTELRNKYVNKLLSCNILKKKYVDFEELYNELVSINITQGDLFRYDLARRIGYCLGIRPQNYVYLHKGAQKGAEELHKKGYIALPVGWEKHVRIDIFSSIFPNIDAIDIENLLCIYKEAFCKLKTKS